MSKDISRKDFQSDYEYEQAKKSKRKAEKNVRDSRKNRDVVVEAA